MQLLRACQLSPALLLQVLDFPHAKAAKAFAYDHEWLATLRSTHHLFTLDRRQRPLPGEAVSISQARFAMPVPRAGPVSATACQKMSSLGSAPLPETASLHVSASKVLDSNPCSRGGIMY